MRKNRRVEQVEAIRAQLHTLVDTAVSPVREILAGSDVPAGVRLKAAVIVLGAFKAQVPGPIGTTDPKRLDKRTNSICWRTGRD
jgi:hypothetical protein